MANQDNVKSVFEALRPVLNERMRRLVAAAEAQALGHGGVTLVAEATGLARSTITEGIAELAAPSPEGGEQRLRRPGGGRKRLTDHDPTLLRDLEGLVEPATRGDPESPLRWTCKSLSKLAAALENQGHQISGRKVGDLLRALDYSLQATREGMAHPDRNAQFEHINAQALAFQQRGQPVISVDTKKKELVGEFKNEGREWQPREQPELVRVHDFLSEAEGESDPLWCLRRRDQPRLGQRRHRPRYRRVRGRDHATLVGTDGRPAVSRCHRVADYGRWRRKQRQPLAFVEGDLATIR